MNTIYISSCGNLDLHSEGRALAQLALDADLPADPQTDAFSDADAFDDWFSGAAEEMRTAGLLKGYEDGSFRPNNPITRAEIAVILDRYIGVKDFVV